MHFHGRDRRRAVRHYGARDSLHAEPARIPDPDCGLPARRARGWHSAYNDSGTAAMQAIHPRYLILTGLLLAGGTLYYMTGFSLDVTETTIVVTSIVQGIGLGLLFVPISTVAFATLPSHLRTGATAITTLTRNIGSSIGISMVIANLTSKTTEMHARL